MLHCSRPLNGCDIKTDKKIIGYKLIDKCPIICPSNKPNRSSSDVMHTTKCHNEQTLLEFDTFN